MWVMPELSLSGKLVVFALAPIALFFDVHEPDVDLVDLANVVERRSLPARMVQFYHEVQDEMRKVTWPDRAQLKDTTIKIIIFVLFIGAVIGVIDLVLQMVLVKGIPSLFTRS